MSSLAAPVEECDVIASIRRKLEKLARTDLPILLVGEPGTGRQTLARQIAELRQQKTGALAHAIHGSEGLGVPPFLSRSATPLAIEEMHLMPDADQMRLASWIKDGLVLLSATTLDDADISFTPQLAAVLSYPSDAIKLPPLRARGSDAVRWAEYFLARVGSKLRFAEGAKQAIQERAWPGNLSELRATVERAGAVTERDTIPPESLCSPGAAQSPIVPLSEAVAEFKRRYILEAVERFGGNRSKAARALGVDPRTVFRVLQQEESRR